MKGSEEERERREKSDVRKEEVKELEASKGENQTRRG